MNIPDILSYSKTRITETGEKFPLILFAVAILRAVYLVLHNLIYAIFGAARFFAVIAGILGVLETIAVILLGVYLILLFVKQKQPVHLVAGIFLLLNCFVGTIALSSICWLIFAVCLAWSSLKDDDENAKNSAKLALLAVIVYVALSFLSMAMWRTPRFVNGVFYMILAAVSAVQLVLLLVLFLHDADALGGVKTVVDGVVSKVRDKGASSAGEQPLPVADPLQDSVPAAAEPVAAAAITETPAPVSASSGNVNYQYKTVAGPVGLTVDKNTNYADGVTSYAAIIAQESVDGWVFDSIHEIPVTKNNGCLAALMGRGTTTVHFNMLIFRREI